MQRIFKEISYQFRWALPIWFIKILTDWWPNNKVSNKFRGYLYRPFFGQCGTNLQVAPGVILLNTHKISIGNNVYLSYRCWLNGLGGLYLEDEVVLGPSVVISTLTHCRKNGSYRFGGAKSGEIVIGRGSWLAAHSSVKCGVSIGAGCLIGANSSVVKDVPKNSFAGGVPAIVVKSNLVDSASEEIFYSRF